MRISGDIFFALKQSFVEINFHKTKSPCDEQRLPVIKRDWNYILPESSLLALKRATFLALILMVAPVAGLRPLRAALFETENVPKPTKISLLPDFKVLVTPSMNESNAAPACTLVMPASSAILLTSSALFIVFDEFVV